MRLSARLALSHTVLAGVLLAALALTSAALVRMTAAVGEIRDAHLASLDADQDVHRAAWGTEVALRHGLATCLRDDGPAREPAVHRRAGSHEDRTRPRAAEPVSHGTSPKPHDMVTGRPAGTPGRPPQPCPYGCVVDSVNVRVLL